ncbi:FkbM family methyltransferase [Saccharopolyspora cebuensis]|uniref:FkbM family methyltransferase n=1 Tax=Saccharopolyspora cebuensis TaxID=418759 RepID=A0ABV4CFH7_9PSEU
MTGLRLVEIDDAFSCYSPANGNPVLSEAVLIYDEIFRRDTYLGGLGPIDPRVVVDAGANIGLFTLFVKQRFPAASVLAVEPVPQNVAALRANLALHGVSGVTVHAGGLSDREGDARFFYFPAMPGNSTVHLDGKLADKRTVATYAGPEVAEQVYRHEECAVAVRPLSAVLRGSAHAEGDIDLLKVDVEGSEEAVLAGVSDADWRRIRHVVLEVHTAGGALDRVADLLRERGFAVELQDAAAAPKGTGTRMVYARRG